MSITRVGANRKYAAGWDKIFGGAQKSRAAAKPTKPAAESKKKASPKKSAGKRSK